MVDSIRGVRVTFASTNGRGGGEERISEISRIVRMPNVGLGGSDVCGGPPTLGAGLSASLGVTGTGETVVELKWERSPEDGEGENDVIRYVVWRRPAGSGDWGTPYLSIPAGKERYLYRDADLVMGEAYQYAIAAQDCTPTLSAMAVARPITVPLK